MDILNQTLWGNSVLDWLIAALIFIVSIVGLRIIQNLIQDRLSGLTKKIPTKVDDLTLKLVRRTHFIFIIILALFLSAQTLSLDSAVSKFLNSLILVALILQGAMWGLEVIDYIVKYKVQKDEEDRSAANAISIVFKVALWIIVVLLILENVTNVEINSLLATLGVGSVAVALAVQNILGDLFSSLSINLDKPFVIGDTINIGDMTGTVENIGLKSTRLRSLTGEQLIFSNSDLLSSRIRNYERMERRQVSFKLGVASDTPHQKLAAIPKMLHEIISEQENTSFTRAHFTSFGDFAMIIDCVYFMEVPDYQAYMDTLQAVNLEIYRRFEEAGIQMPYPTQTVLLEKQASL